MSEPEAQTTPGSPMASTSFPKTEKPRQQIKTPHLRPVVKPSKTFTGAMLTAGWAALYEEEEASSSVKQNKETTPDHECIAFTHWLLILL
jgi:hypothetical protein